jgi:hypothetical protein
MEECYMGHMADHSLSLQVSKVHHFVQLQYWTSLNQHGHVNVVSCVYLWLNSPNR